MDSVGSEVSGDQRVMKVYEAICAVTQEMSRMGISKDHRNSQQGYQFRGIDDVYRALSPLLARHRLCILPRVVEQTVVERPTQKGGMLFYTTVKMDFDFVSAVDGTKHTVTMIGEAMDSADKSSNKAQSAAYKYACFQAFCIPTEGDNDADATTHEVTPDTTALLTRLRDASMKGSDALQATFKEINKANGFKDVWMRHADSLKAAALAADPQ